MKGVGIFAVRYAPQGTGLFAPFLLAAGTARGVKGDQIAMGALEVPRTVVERMAKLGMRVRVAI